MPKGQFTAADVQGQTGQFSAADVSADAGIQDSQTSTYSQLTAPYNPNVQDRNPIIRSLDAAGGALLGFPGSVYHAFADQPTPEETEEAGGPREVSGPKRIGLGLERLIAKPAVSAAKDYASGKVSLGGAMSVLPEAIGTGIGTYAAGGATEAGLEPIAKGVANLPGDVTAVNKMRKYANATGDPFRVGLQVAAHDMLSKAADMAKQKLRDSEALVSARVGGLKDDIANADIQAGAPKIPIGDMLPQIDELAQRYKAAGGSLPKFDAVSDRVANASPYLTFDEAAAIRTEVGRSWKGARLDADSAAVNEVYTALTSKLKDRAEELGHSKTFEDYNGLWSTKKMYDSGPLGDLLNAPDGKAFFDTLRDPKNGAALRRINDSLTDFGLSKNYLSDLAKDHATLHQFANTSGGLGFMGRFRALMQHPVAGGVGWMAGRALGGWPGGMLGTIGGANLADALKVSRDISSKGGPLDTTGEMKQFTSKPSGKPLDRTAQPSGPMKNELIDALKSQGLKSKDATAAAIRAIQKNPKGTFGELFGEAIRRQQ